MLVHVDFGYYRHDLPVSFLQGDRGVSACEVLLSMRHGVSAELGVNPGLELTRMSPEEIQSVTISYD